jgi:lysozyme
LTFNAGDKWARSGLGEAVRSGDLDTVRALFLEYNKAGGKELPGLSDRRAVEALWIGNSDAADGSTAASAATPYAVRVGAGPSTVGSVRPGIAAMALALANPADAQTPRSVAPAADTAPAADASAMQAAPLRASAETASPEVAALVRQLLGDAAAERARLGTQGLAPLADFARLRPPEEERDRARRSAADGIERA